MEIAIHLIRLVYKVELLVAALGAELALRLYFRIELLMLKVHVSMLLKI